MSTQIESSNKSNHLGPWNKGKLVGPKPPLQPRHVWAIRTRLALAGQTRDLALFNLAIDSKLRGCDVVSLKVEDVAPHGYTIDRATVRQKKTARLSSKSPNRPDRRLIPFLRPVARRSAIICRIPEALRDGLGLNRPRVPRSTSRSRAVPLGERPGRRNDRCCAMSPGDLPRRRPRSRRR